MGGDITPLFEDFVSVRDLRYRMLLSPVREFKSN